SLVMGGRLQKRMASSSFRIMNRAAASPACCGLSVNRAVFSIMCKKPRGGRLLLRRNRLSLPPSKRTFGPDPCRHQTLAGFPQTVHPRTTLTVPETGPRAMALRCLEMLCGSDVDFPQQLLPSKGAKVLRQLQALALIVGTQALAVTFRGRISQ